MKYFFFIGIFLTAAVLHGAEAIRWADGQWDTSGAPQGKLLSDNACYYGESVLTGVTYTYTEAPRNPPDDLKRNGSGIFGRRLLDGRIGGDWYVPVGNSFRPLEMIFDFKRPCRFTEVDLYTARTPEHTAILEFSPDGQNWSGRIERKANANLNRIRLPGRREGRYLKLIFQTASRKKPGYLDEVMVWGDAMVSEQYPEDVRPLKVPAPEAGMLQSLRGVRQTVFSEKEFRKYRNKIGRAAHLPVIWGISQESTPSSPVLPLPGAELHLLMARNETESVFLTLTNPSEDRISKVAVKLPEAPEISYEIRIGGILPVNRPPRKLTEKERLDLLITGDLPPDAEPENAMQVLPFFAPGKMLPAGMMRRYLANGGEILGFPELPLKPGESAVMMLRIRTDKTPPGKYRTMISARSATGKSVELPLTIQVADLTLPEVPAWVCAWGGFSSEFPFETRERCLNDVRHMRELGANVVSGFPEPGTKAELFRRTGKSFYKLRALPPGYINLAISGKISAESLNDEHRNAIAAHIKGLVRKAVSLNLSFEEWFVELWDEPGRKNAAVFGALAKLIKQINPQVRVYMNPCFWEPGFPPQTEIVKSLSPYYNQTIDVSCPIMNLVNDNLTTDELWTHPRQVNALYLHPARRAGREISYRSFRYGMNGWAYYCYFAPRGNPWDILTWRELGYAYQMVFPLHSGVAITPIYETMREGAEDFRILHALKQNGKTKLLAELLKEQRKNKDYRLLREKALKAFLP